MNVKFLSDYCGRETAMREYKTGVEVELPFAQASELIRLGIVEEVLPFVLPESSHGGSTPKKSIRKVEK